MKIKLAWALVAVVLVGVFALTFPSAEAALVAYAVLSMALYFAFHVSFAAMTRSPAFSSTEGGDDGAMDIVVMGMAALLALAVTALAGMLGEAARALLCAGKGDGLVRLGRDALAGAAGSGLCVLLNVSLGRGGSYRLFRFLLFLCALVALAAALFLACCKGV